MNIINKTIHDKVKLKSIVTLIIYVSLMVVAAIVFSKYVDREALQVIVKNSGNLGIISYFLIEVIYVTLTPLLNTAILITSGYIFGGHIGFLMNFLLLLLGYS